MGIETALALIESVKSKRALFIGETIVDEYRFVSPLAKPSKENILAVKLERVETYLGGVVAAARHAESFCKASFASPLGRVRKVRYVEDGGRKLFEVQTLPNELGELSAHSNDQDVFAITDFGHGLPLLSSDGFLAVATQTNAANHGFNLITKYGKADYIVIDEPEARLAAADRHSPIEEVIRKLAAGRCAKFVVTHGKHGAYGWDGERFYHSKAMSDRVVDTMGAGDAFFAVTAPMAKTGSMEDLLLIGNAAGALKTRILGHREAVTKTALIDFLKAHEPH